MFILSKDMNQKEFEEYRKVLKFGKCPACQSGHFENCTATRKNAHAYMIDKTGKIKWYCNLGCILLQLDQRGVQQVVEGEVGSEGHYEKSINSMYSDRELLGSGYSRK